MNKHGASTLNYLDRNQSTRRFCLPLLTLVCGIVASVFLWQVLHNVEKSALREEFEREAKERSDSFRSHIAWTLELLGSAQAFFESSQAVDESEFSSFIRASKFQQNGIQEIAWVPRVLEVDRSAYENSREGVIQEQDAAGTWQPALGRDLRFPVDYFHPQGSRFFVAGEDLLARPALRSALALAASTGSIVATPPVAIPGTEDPVTFLVAPVYSQVPEEPSLQHSGLDGLLVARVSIPKILQNSLQSLKGEGIVFTIVDEAVPTLPLWHVLGSGKILSTDKQVAAISGPAASWNSNTEVDFADRQLLVRCRPMAGYLNNGNSNWPLIALIGGTALTLLLSGYFRTVLERSARIEELVAVRTVELDEANRSIQRELEERARAEETLQSFKMTLDLTHDCVFILEPKTFRFLYVNQGSTEKLGYSEEELLLMTPVNITSDVTYDMLRNNSEMLISGQQKSIMIESLHLCKDGSEVPMEVLIQYAAAKCGKPCLIAIARDITERKRTEEELRKAIQTADMANRSKSDFLASMSHELRTPLNGVVGMTELLTDTDLDSRQREFVRACQCSARSLMSIVNDILDFSKIEAGRLELEDHEFDLLQMLDDLMSTMIERTRGKDVELSYFLDYNDPLLLMGDSNRLRQVLANLLSNAIKFTQAGDIVLRAEPRRLTKDLAVIHFSVQDSGIGIPAERLDRLFKPFTQVDSSTSRHYGGTGLGLSICKSLAEAMGGEIGVESSPGKGSTFWFQIPFRRSNEPLRRTVLPKDLTALRVLVVEDHKAARELLREMYLSWKIQVRTACGPKEAIQMLHKALALDEPFDLVLIDETLPKVDDRSLAEIIASEPAFHGLRQIRMLSVEGEFDQAHESYEGCYCLRKPIGQSHLLDAMNNLFHGGAVERTRHEPQTETAPSAESHPAAILLVEDNEINQLVVREVLRKAGYKCDTANNGEEALVAIERKCYDLVLMDCQMPGMDGFEATGAIRDREAASGGARLTIVALTANAIKGDRERCLAAGMDDYLSKPFSPTQLLETVNRILDEKGVAVSGNDASATPPSPQLGDIAIQTPHPDCLL